MTKILISIMAIVVLIGFGVGWQRRRRAARMTPRERANRALRELGRDHRARRRQGRRGTGDHFGRTPIRKYGDERHDNPSADTGGYDGGWSDSGGGGSW